MAQEWVRGKGVGEGAGKGTEGGKFESAWRGC